MSKNISHANNLSLSIALRSVWSQARRPLYQKLV